MTVPKLHQRYATACAQAAALLTAWQDQPITRGAEVGAGVLPALAALLAHSEPGTAGLSASAVQAVREVLASAAACRVVFAGRPASAGAAHALLTKLFDGAARRLAGPLTADLLPARLLLLVSSTGQTEPPNIADDPVGGPTWRQLGARLSWQTACEVSFGYRHAPEVLNPVFVNVGAVLTYEPADTRRHLAETRLAKTLAYELGHLDESAWWREREKNLAVKTGEERARTG